MANPKAEDKNSKAYFIRRLGALELERSSFITHWKELSEYIDPRRGRFFLQDRNRGERRHNKIINSRGTQAKRTAESGLFAGVMSPSQNWFKFEPLNKALLQVPTVKAWLYDVEQLLRAIFLDSNLYNQAPIMLGEMVQFGTGAMSQIADFESVVRFDTHTAGSYLVGTNQKNEVDTFVLDKEWTCGQIVSEFGLENVSQAVKDCYERCDYDKWFRVVQFIEPNHEYKPGNPFYKKFRSVWFEPSNQGEDAKKFLRTSGFDRFPVRVARWALTGEDIYGTNSPGMIALGDIKGLQIMEKRMAQGIEKLVNPPLKGPPSLLNRPVSALPGGMNIYDADNTKEGLTTLYQVEPRVNELRQAILEAEKRINEAFYVDLFLAISNMDGIQPRNQLELQQRNAERLLMLGPPLERIQQDFLGAIVEDTFAQAAEAGILPEAPPELQGQSLNVRFVSSLAQAQKAQEVGVIERVAQFVGAMAGMKPQVLDKFNADQAVEQYAQLLGAVPTIIVPDEVVAKMRQQQAQQQQAAMQAEMLAKSAGAAADLGAGAKSVAEARNV